MNTPKTEVRINNGRILELSTISTMHRCALICTSEIISKRVKYIKIHADRFGDNNAHDGVLFYVEDRKTLNEKERDPKATLYTKRLTPEDKGILSAELYDSVKSSMMLSGLPAVIISLYFSEYNIYLYTVVFLHEINSRVVVMHPGVVAGPPKKEKTEDLMPPNISHCICGKWTRDDGTALQLCSLCRMVVYCSRECQKKDWGKHKSTCIALQEHKKKLKSARKNKK